MGSSGAAVSSGGISPVIGSVAVHVTCWLFPLVQLSLSPLLIPGC